MKKIVKITFASIALLSSFSLADAKPSKAEIIAEFDKDGDGKLNQSEQAAMKEKAKQKRLEKFDSNGDGVIDGEGKRTIKMDAKEKIFSKIDVNADGMISQEEWMSHHFSKKGGKGKKSAK